MLFQAGRAAEGVRAFRSLRGLWRESENFVHVPERLRWLRSGDSVSLQTVRAVLGSDYGNRAMARVQEFGNALVPFRPEEHGLREVVPGKRFAFRVSFGHNGPFLRPVTAAPAQVDRGIDGDRTGLSPAVRGYPGNPSRNLGPCSLRERRMWSYWS